MIFGMVKLVLAILFGYLAFYEGVILGDRVYGVLFALISLEYLGELFIKDGE